MKRVITVLLMAVMMFSIQAANAEIHTKYTLYIGLNDGTTGKQVCTMDEAKWVFFSIAGKYIDGYTVYEAEGFWREGEKVFTEKTLVCVLVDAKEEAVKKIMDEALEAFHQRSILLEKGATDSTFYDGK